LAAIVISQGLIMFFLGDVPFAARTIDVFIIATPVGAIIGFFIGIREVQR